MHYLRSNGDKVSAHVIGVNKDGTKRIEYFVDGVWRYNPCVSVLRLVEDIDPVLDEAVEAAVNNAMKSEEAVVANIAQSEEAVVANIAQSAKTNSVSCGKKKVIRRRWKPVKVEGETQEYGACVTFVGIKCF